MATSQPERLTAMVLVSSTPYFPAQARSIMSQYSDSLPEAQWEILRRRHPGGDAQIKAILASTKAFADSYDEYGLVSRRGADTRVDAWLCWEDTWPYL